MLCDDGATQGRIPGKVELSTIFGLPGLVFSVILTYSLIVGVWPGSVKVSGSFSVDDLGAVEVAGAFTVSSTGVAGKAKAKAKTLDLGNTNREGRRQGDTHLGLLKAVPIGLS